MTVADAVESLDRYVKHGIPPGSFLLAVLSNDLMQAVNRADEESAANLREIVSHVYNRLPSGSHGSMEKVEAWVEHIRVIRARG